MSQAASPELPRRPGLARRLVRWVLPVLVIAVTAGIWQRERLWIWYCAERLEHASADDQAIWADKLAAAGEPAIPSLLKSLRHDDPGVCAFARTALENIVTPWDKDDPRRLAFAYNFVEAEPRFSTPGRAVALDLLPMVIATDDSTLVGRAKEIVATAAKSESVDLRIQAVAVAMRPDVDCLAAIVLLVNDPTVDVRRVAVLALGPVRDGARPALADDGLLRCLHDEDAEVRRMAEMGLRSRGRTTHDIRLGKRYAAPDPAERQKLLIDLAYEDKLDVTVWLERLTADSDPAVRAGAARLAAERQANLGSRLDQMIQHDPNPTVRRIAQFYRQKMLNAH